MTKNCLSVITALAIAGCTATVGGPGEVGSAEENLALEASDAIELAGILGYELSGLLTNPPGLGDEEPPGDDEPIPGPGGSLPAGSSGCTDVDWSPENLFGITLTFDNCVLDNGDTVHGSVAVRLNNGIRRSVDVDLDNLAVGERFITGTMSLSTDGTDIQIDADLRYIDGDTNMGIELEAVRLRIRGDGVHLSGVATITESADRWHAVLNDVTWSVRSLCHPTDGSIDLSMSGRPSMTIAFSAGGVTLTVGMDDPVMLPSRC